MTKQAVFKGIQKELKKIGLKKMQELVGKKFFDMDDVVEVLYRTFIAGKNVILYGPGGFGKSTVVVEFLKQAKIKHSTIVGYEDMDVEGLLGIPNMDKLLNKSVYETAFDRTAFVNPGVLLLEEFLDVNPKTAIALKDIITEGGLRQGNSFTESLISSIVICSNKSPYEVSTDYSTTAFYRERFPIVCEVSWKVFDYSRYLSYIQKIVTSTEFSRHEETYMVLAELAARTSASGELVSPRIVRDAVDFLKANDYEVECLTFIDGLDTDIIDEVYTTCVYRKEESRINAIKYNIDQRVEELTSQDNSSTRNLLDSIVEIKLILRKLEEEHIESTDNVNTFNAIKISCDNAVSLLWVKLKPSEEHAIVDHIFEV